ncbi:MAG: hypothetical protein LBU13_04595 [Synergistaceae bacterium]|jgi:hypothetical protein|nr:hypothetical protein [Synergistaceae bacterium]
MAINEEVEERIRRTALNTDKLIVRLDTLSNRIDTAKSNDNQDLVEYYERMFAEASVEFMDGVESILDDWYVLKGEARPPAEIEHLSPETLNAVHNAVVSIVQGQPVVMPEPLVANHEIDAAQGINIPHQTGPNHKLDVTG